MVLVVCFRFPSLSAACVGFFCCVFHCVFWGAFQSIYLLFSAHERATASIGLGNPIVAGLLAGNLGLPYAVIVFCYPWLSALSLTNSFRWRLPLRHTNFIQGGPWRMASHPDHWRPHEADSVLASLMEFCFSLTAEFGSSPTFSLMVEFGSSPTL